MEEQKPEPQTPSPEQHSEHHEEHHEPEHPHSNLKSKWPFLIIALLLVLLGIFGAYFAMNQSKQNQTPTPTPAIENSNQAQSQATSTPTPTTAVDATANWKLYTNSASGYSIKYPSENYVRLICPDEELVLKTKTAQDTKDEISMETCGRGGRFEIEVVSASSFTEPTTDEFVSVTKEEITVAGVTARKYISTKKPAAEGPVPDYSEDIYLDNGGKKHLIHFGSTVSDDIKNKILSTFKFI